MKKLILSAVSILAMSSALAGGSWSISLNVPIIPSQPVYNSYNTTSMYVPTNTTMMVGTQVPYPVCTQVWRNGFPVQECHTEYQYVPQQNIITQSSASVTFGYPGVQTYSPYVEHHHHHHNNQYDNYQKPYNPYGGANIQYRERIR